MDAETTAPMAAAATATVIIELKDRPRMIVSSCLQLMSLQRIVFNAHKIRGAVFCRRVRASALRIGEFFHARSPHKARETIVSFDAAWLVIKSVVLVALPGELLLDGPSPSPHRRIFDGHDIFKRGWSDPRPALDQVQVLKRPLKVGLRAEVRHVDDERIALPVATRVAVPLTNTGRQVRTSVHDDVPLPPLALTDVVENRDAARRLHDPPETTGCGSKLGQAAGQAAIWQ